MMKRSWRSQVSDHREKGFTLVEILVATAITAILSTVLFTMLLVSRQTTDKATVEQNLQQNVNSILNKIIKGGSEPTGTFRLSEAASYQIVGTNDLRFKGIDGITRRLHLDASGTSLLYNHPTAAGTADETIYTAPPGSTLTVRFWVLTGTQYANVTLGIDIGLSTVASGGTVSGSATTMINIRNHRV